MQFDYPFHLGRHHDISGMAVMPDRIAHSLGCGRVAAVMLPENFNCLCDIHDAEMMQKFCRPVKQNISIVDYRKSAKRILGENYG